jgi:DNA-binding LytR/AlgR family response regulator
MKLSSIEKELQKEHFFRCQKACLVNLSYVEGITKETVLIKDKELPVSRLKMQALRKELARIIGENL